MEIEFTHEMLCRVAENLVRDYAEKLSTEGDLYWDWCEVVCEPDDSAEHYQAMAILAAIPKGADSWEAERVAALGLALHIPEYADLVHGMIFKFERYTPREISRQPLFKAQASEAARAFAARSTEQPVGPACDTICKLA